MKIFNIYNPSSTYRPIVDRCDAYTGEVLPRIGRHAAKALAASKKPYRLPIPPSTLEELDSLIKDHIVHWHTVQVDMDIDLLLGLDITMSDLRVLTSLANGVKYHNYSATRIEDISAEYDMTRRTIHRSLNKLIDLNLVRSVSLELMAVRPSLSWRGDYNIQHSSSASWIKSEIGRSQGYLWSDEYIETVRKRYEGNYQCI